MPRKSKSDAVSTPATQPVEASPKKRVSRARKPAVVEPETVAATEAISEPAAVPAPRARRIGKAVVESEAVPVEQAVKPASRRIGARPKPQAEAEVPEVQAPEEADQPKSRQKAPAVKAAKPVRASRAAKTPPLPAESGDENEIIVSFRAISRAAKPVAEPPQKPSDQAEKPSRGRRIAGKPAPARNAPETTLDEFGDELPVPMWRAIDKAAQAAAEASDSDDGDRRDRTRKPRESRDTRESREPRAPREPREPRTTERPERPLTTAFVPPTIPQPPKPAGKPLIAKPDDAPQVVLRDGIPTLVREHRVYPPILFFGNPSDERRAATVLEQLKTAAEAGVHLHAHLIDLEVDQDSVGQAVGFAGYMLNKSVEADPEAQVLFRIVFKAPRGWQDKYPDARYRDFYGNTAEPSFCDDKFWDVARDCLTSFVSQMRKVPEWKHILGVQLDRGEWFTSEDAGYDDSRAAEVMFREWARTRYSNDQVTLKASWFDGAARFDSIQIPNFNPEGAEGEKFIRSSRKQRRHVDYHLFLSDATVHRIGELAYTAKEASEGYFLVGASYGYTFEWSHPSSGHLSLGKLLRTPEIDFVAGPPSYRTREPGGAAPFPCPIDSFALNGKLYISEEDFKTSLAVGHEPDDFNPPLRTPQALESVHWRGAGAALAHGAGVAWMDLWGNGWLKTPSVWERAARVQRALVDRMEAPLGDPDVAIFIDERSLAYLVEPHAFQVLVQNVRESVLRAGVSAGFYLLSDLAHREKFPESKLYIFLNAWDIRPDLRSAIKSRLQRDNKVLFWLYSAGLFDAGRESLERAREVTGIALKPQPYHSRSGTTILNKRHPLSEAFPDRMIGGAQLEPSYFAIPEGATVLGEYSQTGLPSFVVKEFREGAAETHWTSVFLGEPQVNPALIRALAQMSGVHVWNFQDDVVHVRPPFLTVHCTGPGSRTIAMPPKFSAYDFINEVWMGDSSNVRINGSDGSTSMLMVGPKTEIEHLLTFDPADRLRMDELPPADTNERVDVSNFDVPMMRLDEWMERDDSDDVADEWFLRAPQVEIEQEQATESPERIGKRRRRRGPRERNGHDSNVETFVADTGEEVDINVMFRKRS